MDYTQFDHIENWTPFEIMKWHEVCFPLATLESQVIRYEEECDEFFRNEVIEEVADMFISCFGMARFSTVVFSNYINAAMFMIEEDEDCEFYNIEDVSQAINDKMKINLQRWKDGEWKWDEQTQQYKRGK